MIVNFLKATCTLNMNLMIYIAIWASMFPHPVAIAFSIFFGVLFVISILMICCVYDEDEYQTHMNKYYNTTIGLWTFFLFHLISYLVMRYHLDIQTLLMNVFMGLSVVSLVVIDFCIGHCGGVYEVPDDVYRIHQYTLERKSSNKNEIALPKMSTYAISAQPPMNTV